MVLYLYLNVINSFNPHKVKSYCYPHLTLEITEAQILNTLSTQFVK